MTSDLLLPLAALLPLLFAALAASPLGSPRAPRRWAIAGAAVTSACAAALLVQTLRAPGAELALALVWRGSRLCFASDGASALLAVVAAVVTVGALLFTPRSSVDRRLAGAVLLGEAGTMLALLSPSPVLVLAGWAASMSPLLVARAEDRVSRLAGVAAVLSVGALGTALLLASTQGRAGLAGALAPWASLAWIVAALARAGVPPLHGWVPVALHRAPVAAAIPTVMSPLPLLALARSMEHGVLEPPWLAALLVGLGASGAVYGALLAMVQHELRRALGYVNVSVVAASVAALGSATEAGITGAVLGGVSGTVALSGLVLLASAVGARTGTCDMRRLGGLHVSMPLGGAIFLLCGVALVGLPGTFGFISEDLAMQGLVPSHPVVALVILAATALNAVTLFRCFNRTFLGPPSPHGEPPEQVEDLLPRERATAMLWAAILVVGGFLPAPLLAIQSSLEPAEPSSSVAADRVLRGATREPTD